MEHEKFERKVTYEFCEIRKTMVELQVIQSTATLPDLVNAEARLMPVECNRQSQCRREGIRCIVYDKYGQDPCPGIWNG